MLTDVLAEDPQLAARLPASDLSAAHRALLARSIALRPGRWTPDFTEAEMDGALGLLVLGGLLKRQLCLAGGQACELLGRTDLLRPWDDDRAEAPIPAQAEWHILQPTRLAVLDRHFTQAAGAWPELLVTFHSRLVRRARWLSCFLALTQIPRLEVRLLAALWHLADRWGTVGAGGVTVALPLTHGTLADLLGAQRPSVSRSMRSLEVAGLVECVPRGGWILRGDAQTAVERVRAEPVTRVTGPFRPAGQPGTASSY